MLKLAFQCLAVALLLTAAEAQSPVAKTELFEIVLAPDCKVINASNDGWETKMVVEHQGQRVRMSWRDHQALLMFPKSTLRLTVEETAQGRSIWVNLDGEKYQVKQTDQEISWHLPQEQVFFQTWGGQIHRAVGTADFLNLHKQTLASRITVESNAGSTNALIASDGKLETFDGPDILAHHYWVRGLAFQQGPATLRIPLPNNRFLQALPKDRFLTVTKELQPLQPAAAEQPGPEEPTKDPLQAEERTWSSPELNATLGSSKEDPIGAKREKRIRNDQDPLRATPTKNSDKVLQVRQFDPNGGGEQ